MLKCERCGKDTRTLLISVFNTQKLCNECLDKEEKHKNYEEAINALKWANEKGKKDFEGIGWDG